MNITIEINTDNDAFQHGYLNTEVKRILEVIHLGLHTYPIQEKKLYDINGNVCGSVKISEND